MGDEQKAAEIQVDVLEKSRLQVAATGSCETKDIADTESSKPGVRPGQW